MEEVNVNPETPANETPQPTPTVEPPAPETPAEEPSTPPMPETTPAESIQAVPSGEFVATGRRKTATARVRMKAGTGIIKVNGRAFEDYFPVESYRALILQPLVLTQTEGKFDIRVNVSGGGFSGQAGAIRHGIARALLQYDPTLRPILKKAGMLTRDPRKKERKKPGQPGARKRFQYSKR